MAIKIIQSSTLMEDAPVASSFWWGDPDMLIDNEDDFDWPHTIDGTDLLFIGQINLSDLPFETPLPKSGLLLFFADIDYFLGNFDAEPCGGIGLWPKDACKVIYYPVDSLNRLSRIHFLDNGEVCTPRARGITFAETSEHGYDLKLFGQPSCFEHDDWPEPCVGWQLLLQVDTEEVADHNLRFYDDGLLYFIIDPEDLRSGRFDRVRAFMYSS